MDKTSPPAESFAPDPAATTIPLSRQASPNAANAWRRPPIPPVSPGRRRSGRSPSPITMRDRPPGSAPRGKRTRVGLPNQRAADPALSVRTPGSARAACRANKAAITTTRSTSRTGSKSPASAFVIWPATERTIPTATSESPGADVEHGRFTAAASQMRGALPTQTENSVAVSVRPAFGEEPVSEATG